ncbi:MAG: CoA transferase [Pirellulales bacterium]|nr:CoA transferase [Pirellulales bacterium]
MSLPLAGIRVLDLSRVLAGPVCCQFLADLGADVVKVERPGTGDDTRQWGPPFVEGDGPSAYYLSANRGKRSLALDLDQPSGRAVLRRLLERADVMVENFLPAAREKFGLSPERLAAINPRLVSASISGFGRIGPLADQPGYDLVIQATSGLMSITGEPDGVPMKVGVALSDIIAGLYAAASVLAGLVGRSTGQPGRAFDLALADCTLASLVNVAQAALVTGERPRRYGNAHAQIVPYEVFATSDGHLVLAVGNDRQWQRFCAVASRQEWANDPRFATNPARVRNRDALVPAIKALVATMPTDDWLRLLDEAEVPHAAVLPLDTVLTGQQAAAREMVVEVQDRAGRRYHLLGSPVHWAGETRVIPAAPPALGQHSEEVLREWLATSDQELVGLRASRTIEQASRS